MNENVVDMAATDRRGLSRSASLPSLDSTSFVLPTVPLHAPVVSPFARLADASPFPAVGPRLRAPATPDGLNTWLWPASPASRPVPPLPLLPSRQSRIFDSLYDALRHARLRDPLTNRVYRSPMVLSPEHPVRTRDGQPQPPPHVYDADSLAAMRAAGLSHDPLGGVNLHTCRAEPHRTLAEHIATLLAKDPGLDEAQTEAPLAERQALRRAFLTQWCSPNLSDHEDAELGLQPWRDLYRWARTRAQIEGLALALTEAPGGPATPVRGPEPADLGDVEVNAGLLWFLRRHHAFLAYDLNREVQAHQLRSLETQAYRRTSCSSSASEGTFERRSWRSILKLLSPPSNPAPDLGTSPPQVSVPKQALALLQALYAERAAENEDPSLEDANGPWNTRLGRYRSEPDFIPVTSEAIQQLFRAQARLRWRSLDHPSLNTSVHGRSQASSLLFDMDDLGDMDTMDDMAPSLDA